MAASTHYPYPIPGTPRVTSPSPTPSEPAGNTSREGYFGPITRSISSRAGPRVATPRTINEDDHKDEASSSDPDNRARARSVEAGSRRARTKATGSARATGVAASPKASLRKPEPIPENNDADGHLSPFSLIKGSSVWRDISRSPSPLGLIPIHREFRSFVHRHEIPRKFLHVSIGFVTLYLYASGHQPLSLTPFLFVLLLPIATADFLRHRNQPFNDFYIRVLGALMRESEVTGWNGTVWYLLGTLGALACFPKDVGVMAVLLLSWCDTAASTFGRLYGRYTPRIRRGKSLAGSVAACIMGIGTAALFWGYVAPRFGREFDVGENAFAFQGHLQLPTRLSRMLGWNHEVAGISGGAALGVVSLWAGLVASASEAIDLFGWDDNLTIPALCGIGLWGFLKVFG